MQLFVVNAAQRRSEPDQMIPTADVVQFHVQGALAYYTC